MIVVHGETLWLPAPQPMDDDDDEHNTIDIIHFHSGESCYVQRFLFTEFINALLAFFLNQIPARILL